MKLQKIQNTGAKSESESEIPESVIIRILLWLPVVTLLRFKSICKSWRSLIESSDFTDQHLRHHRRRHPNGNLIVHHVPSRFTDRKRPSCAYLLSLGDKKSQLLDLPTTDDVYKFSPLQVIASCNGIICLRQHHSICLWNPATRHCRNLPRLPMLAGPHEYDIGFGMHAQTNDYRVVCLSKEGCDRIYSLASDSWRVIDTAILPENTCLGSHLRSTYRNEFFCWVGEIPLSVENEDEFLAPIFSFDFSKEVFEIIPTPDGINSPYFYIELAIIREKLSCVVKVDLNLEQEHPQNSPLRWLVDVWMLNEDYKANVSWTKLYRIGPFSVERNCFSGFSYSGDFLLFREAEPLCLYDFASRETISFPEQVCRVLEVAVYEESLVSIVRRNAATAKNRITCSVRNESKSVGGSNNIWSEIYFPESVVFHILLRLPVLSLLRFKSVCKSWHSLIKSSVFVAEHLRHRHHGGDTGNNNLILHTPDPRDDPLFEDSSQPFPNVSCACLLSAKKFEVLELPYREGWEFGLLNIVASCNGIICLQQEEEDWNVYLWNPATKQFRAIVEDMRFVCDLSEEHYYVGFGYDVRSNDYKVVRFCKRFHSEIQVYNLSTDSWRVIGKAVTSTQDFHIYSGLKAPCWKGIYCWLARIDFIIVIFSFDFANEVFRHIALPDSINSSSYQKELAILRGNIAYIDIGDTSGEIWMLKECAQKESWSKLYVLISFPLEWHCLMAFSNNGDFILFLKERERQLCLFNLATGETKDLPVQVQLEGTEQLTPKFEAVMYEESLVSI